MSRSFLMISPLFPPSRVIGAKRALHFARHLPALGWTPAVVALPAHIEPDPALESLVPDVPIWRGFQGGPVDWTLRALGRPMDYYPDARREARSGAKPAASPGGVVGRVGRAVAGALGAFDRYTAYLPWAIGGAIALARREACSAVYVSVGPRGGLFAADAVARVTGLPLVVDLRDPWSINAAYGASRTPTGQRVVETIERAIFARAARVVVNTESALEGYVDAYRGRIPEERFRVIRNAFDPDLYGPAPPAPGPELPFRIVFFGNLRPARSAAPFLGALRRFVATEGLRPGEAILTTLGVRMPADEAAISDLGLTGHVEAHPQLSFTRCRELLGRADLLLDLNGPAHTMTISGKFYDYLACARPILSVSPNLEIGRILSETGAGRRVDLDEASMVDALRALLADKRAGRPFAPRADAVAEHHAIRAAEKLAAVLDEATG